MSSVIVINGSPRPDGNSTCLALAIADGAVSSGLSLLPIVHLERLHFRGCQNCGGCNATGTCVLRDDLTPVYSALASAGFWILGSPIYFDSISGQLKLFYDRLFCLSKRKLPGRRVAAFAIAYEAGYNENYAKNMAVYQNYLSWFGEFLTSSVVAAHSMAKKGDIYAHPEWLEAARAEGSRLAALLTAPTPQPSPSSHHA